MSASQQLYSNVAKGDPLHFWKGNALNFKEVTDFLDLDKESLSKMSGISKKTVRLDDRIPTDLKTHLEQVANICSLVAEYFGGNPEKTSLWFKAPNPMLGTLTPRDMIRLGRYQKLMKFVLQARAENNGDKTD